MLTEATQQALENLRDPSLLQWYVVPLLAIAISDSSISPTEVVKSIRVD